MSDIHSLSGNSSGYSPDALRMRLREGIDKHHRRLRLGAFALVAFLAAGSFVVQHLLSSTPSGAVAAISELPKAATTESSVELPSSSTKSTTATKTVIVQVVGAVNNPGVIEVASDARINDAVAQAGGTTADADLSRVNLAAKVVDGAQIVVPVIGQPTVAAASTSSSGSSSAPSNADAIININTASVDELDSLPGVGPALAAAIVAQRDRLGSFKSVNELNDVKGIGDSKFADIKDHVTV